VGPATDASFQTGTHTGERFIGSAEGPYSRVAFEAEDIDDVEAIVNYDHRGVFLIIEATGVDEDARHGSLAQLDVDTAREAAISLWQAAEELDRRTDP
jgi:hypothetical protein